MRWPVLAAALVLLSTSASAHDVARDAAASLSANDIIVAALIFSVTALFAVGWKSMPVRRNGSRALPAWRASLFVAAMLVLAAALLPPFDALADRHFSMHMAQHLVLLVVAPPMLAASQAQFAFLQLFPLARRRRVGQWIARTPGLKLAAHHSSAIWFVCLSSVGVLWFWHMPAAYNWAQRDEVVHDAEHLLFLATEIAFWRIILFRREQELRRAGAALILVAMSVQGGLLAALITFTARPMYLPYAKASDALGDQALGGVMMWVIAGTVYLGAFAILFGQALASPRRSGRPRVLSLRQAPGQAGG